MSSKRSRIDTKRERFPTAGREAANLDVEKPRSSIETLLGSSKSRIVKVVGKGSALRQLANKAQAEVVVRPRIKLRSTTIVPAPYLSPPKAVLPEPSSPMQSEPLSVSERRAFISSAAQLGEFVRSARQRQHMTQATLAEQAGTCRRFISELEAGKPRLELERALQVCNVLGIRLLAAEQDAH